MTLFAPSPESTLLANFLQEAVEAERAELSYEELSAVIGMDVQGRPGYGFLLTARNRVHEDFGHFWQCRKNVGLYLVPHDRRARWGNDVTNKKIKKEVVRGEKVMGSTDLSQCNEQDIIQFNSGAARLMIYKMLGERWAQKKLGLAVTPDPEQKNRMSLDGTLRWLGLRRDDNPKPTDESPESNTTA